MALNKRRVTSIDVTRLLFRDTTDKKIYTLIELMNNIKQKAVLNLHSLLFLLYTYRYYFASIVSIFSTSALNSASSKRRVSITIFPSRSMRTLRVIPEFLKA